MNFMSRSHVKRRSIARSGRGGKTKDEDEDVLRDEAKNPEGRLIRFYSPAAGRELACDQKTSPAYGNRRRGATRPYGRPVIRKRFMGRREFSPLRDTMEKGEVGDIRWLRERSMRLRKAFNLQSYKDDLIRKHALVRH